MILVKIKDGEVEKFPYTMDDLRADNPNVSFPTIPSDEILNSYSVYEVYYHPYPVFDKRTHYVNIAQTPILIDGVWTMTREVMAKSEAEIEAYDLNELHTLKNSLFDKIDVKTTELIIYGWRYLGKNIRLNNEDQNNYEGEFVLIKDFIADGVPEAMAFPTVFKVWTNDDGVPVFFQFNNLSEMKSFIYTGKLYIRECITVGWTLKNSLDSMTINELRAWVDPRA